MDKIQQEQLWILFRDIQNKTREKMRVYRDQLGISTQEALLLRDLGANPGITLAELSAHLGLTKSTVSSMVTRLETRGLILREIPPENRRIIRLRLSDAFENNPEMKQFKTELLETLFGQIPEEEGHMIIKGFQALHHFLDDSEKS